MSTSIARTAYQKAESLLRGAPAVRPCSVAYATVPLPLADIVFRDENRSILPTPVLVDGVAAVALTFADKDHHWIRLAVHGRFRDVRRDCLAVRITSFDTHAATVYQALAFVDAQRRREAAHSIRREESLREKLAQARKNHEKECADLLAKHEAELAAAAKADDAEERKWTEVYHAHVQNRELDRRRNRDRLVEAFTDGQVDLTTLQHLLTEMYLEPYTPAESGNAAGSSRRRRRSNRAKKSSGAPEVSAPQHRDDIDAE